MIDKYRSGLLLLALIIECLFFTGAHAQSSTTANQQRKLPFTIEGQLKDFKKKRAVIYVGWTEPWERHEFLHADVMDGKFKVSGEMSQPAVANLRIVTLDDSLKPEQKFPWECDAVELFLSDGRTTITGADSLSTATITSPSKEYQLYRQYTEELSPVTSKIDSIMSAWRTVAANKDSLRAKISEHSYWRAVERKHQIYQSFILQNPSSQVSIAALNAYVDEINDKTRLHIARGLFNTLSKPLQTSPIALAIKERIDDKLYPIVGKPMMPVMLQGVDGSTSDIAKYKGKILLIDFWASWCSPCRKEFPELITLYEKYKDNGVEFIGISIDNGKPEWLKAIKDLKLPWPQFIDTAGTQKNSYTGKAAKLYRVSAIPAKYLVSPQGIIVAKNVSIEQFESKIKGMLAAQK